MGLRYILPLNLAGLVLLGSWIAPVTSSLWQAIDDFMFWHFNAFIAPSHPLFIHLLSLASVRLFDLVIFAAMSALLLACALCDRPPEQRIAKWLAAGLLMLAVAGIATVLIHHAIPYEHASPTDYYPNAHRLDTLTSLPVKDSAPNSFPSDHGAMAMIFAAFMLRFAPRAGGVAAIVLALAITAPRLLAGAHWFSDVYMGSLALTLLITPWALFSPLHRLLQRWLARRLNALSKPLSIR